MTRNAAKPPEGRCKIIENSVVYQITMTGTVKQMLLLKIEGPVLEPPVLKYKYVKEFRKVSNGKWLAGRQEKDSLKFLEPMNLNNQGFLDLSNLLL